MRTLLLALILAAGCGGKTPATTEPPGNTGGSGSGDGSGSGSAAPAAAACSTDADCGAGMKCDTCPPFPGCETCDACGPAVCVAQ